jgi:hypothetical protein
MTQEQSESNKEDELKLPEWVILVNQFLKKETKKK